MLLTTAFFAPLILGIVLCCVGKGLAGRIIIAVDIAAGGLIGGFIGFLLLLLSSRTASAGYSSLWRA